jgi:tol-pal system protein YbgF
MRLIFRHLITAFFLLAGSVTAVLAQSSGADREWLNPDVNALREEIAQLRAAVMRLSGQPIDTDAFGSGDVYTRLDQIESEMRRMIGQIEKLAIRQQRIREQIGAAPLPGDDGFTAQNGDPSTQPTGETGSGVLGAIPSDSNAADPFVSDTPKFDQPIAGGATTAAAASAAELAPELAPGAPIIGGIESYQEGLEHLRRNEIDLAAQKFKAFIASAPTDPRVGDATYWLGETFYARGEFGQAARRFLNVFRDHPTTNRAPDSLVKLGMSLVQLGKTPEACRTLQEVEIRYPNATPTVLRRALQEMKNAGCT